MGGRKCSVEGCLSSSIRTEDHGVTFHKYPLNLTIRAAWLSNCRMDAGIQITNSMNVCSRHFRKADFQTFKGKKYVLKHGAVPTIFPWGTMAPVELLKKPESGIPPVVTGDDTASNGSASPIPTAVPAPAPAPVPAPVSASVSSTPVTVKRSASEEQQLSPPPKKAIRKSADAALAKTLASIPWRRSPMKAGSSRRVAPTSTTPKKSELISFVPGTKIEVQDFNNRWHPVEVVEVDTDDREVLIHYEKDLTEKTIGMNDEWLSMDSSRLRILRTPRKSTTSFVIGEKCFARWNDSRKFRATIQKVLPNDIYEVLFDDGYAKTLKSGHIAKMRQQPDTSPTKVPVEMDVSPVPATPVKAPTTPTAPTSSKVDYPPVPEDGEWCCYWIDDAPLGEEGFVDFPDGRKSTVTVKDWRLPDGWTKHFYQRQLAANIKWDVILVNPDNRKFRTKAELRPYLEEQGEVYNAERYDFGIHRRRAKELGLCVYTEGFKPAPEVKSPALPTIKSEPINPILMTPDKSLSTSDIEKGFVYAGALKVQIINNLFRCPKEGCGKNFRKENHLQIHVKHYHADLAKLLGVCPNMTDLAYLRTVGTPMDEPIPRMSSTPIHSDSSAKVPKRSGLTASSTIKLETKTTSTGNKKQGESEPTVKSEEPVRIKMELDVPQESSDDSLRRKCTLLEEALSSKTSLKTSGPIAGATPKAETTERKSSPVSSGNGAPIKRRSRALGFKFSRTRGGSSRKTIEASASQSPFVDYEETRHSFGGGTPDQNVTQSLKARHPQLLDFVHDTTTNSQTTNTTTGSLSESGIIGNPKYITEGGELIKIVRMRQEEIINCLCTVAEEDGLMIQCELCLCWQHGICNGIEKESQVPEKYVCYICRYPVRGRSSQRFVHDQEWLFEGKLPTAPYHVRNPQHGERFELLKQSHTLTGNLLELKRFLHSLKVKVNIAKRKDHPKLYLWSKRWEASPTRIELLAGIEPMRKLIPKIDRETIKTDSELVEILEADNDTPKKDKKVQFEVPTPSAASLGADELQPQEIPNAPQPEAAIEPAECQLRLLEHITKQQSLAMGRLQSIEAQIIGLEAMDESWSKLEPVDNCPKMKQAIQMLLHDLETMQKIPAVSNIGAVAKYL